MSQKTNDGDERGVTPQLRQAANDDTHVVVRLLQDPCYCGNSLIQKKLIESTYKDRSD